MPAAPARGGVVGLEEEVVGVVVQNGVSKAKEKDGARGNKLRYQIGKTVALLTTGPKGRPTV